MTREEALRKAKGMSSNAREQREIADRMLHNYRLNQGDASPWYSETIEGNTVYRMKPGYREKKIERFKEKNPRSQLPEWL